MTATPFETAGGLAFTTLAAETAFIDALVAANPSKVTKTVLGQSVQSRDIYALRFGTGIGAPLLMVTSVHGDETLPREAALTLARDLCETAHPWASLLAERQLILIPTPNPDGFNAQTRVNANGEDINRHYIDYAASSPETRLIVDLFHADLPAAVYDGHEWNGYAKADCFVGIGEFSIGHPQIRAAMIATGEHVAAELLAFGASDAAWYPRDSSESTIGFLSALFRVPTFLMETCEDEYGEAAYFQRRHDRHLVAMSAWLDWMAEHAGEYAALGVQARADMASKVAGGNYFWPIVHLSPVPPATWAAKTAVAVSAGSYTAADIGAASAVLDAHGITYDAGTGVVDLDQVGAAAAAYICDPLGLGLGDCARNIPVVTWTPPPKPTHAFQLWPA